MKTSPHATAYTTASAISPKLPSSASNAAGTTKSNVHLFAHLFARKFRQSSPLARLISPTTGACGTRPCWTTSRDGRVDPENDARYRADAVSALRADDPDGDRRRLCRMLE